MTTIKETLKGVTTGQMQTVGVMSIIPLISDLQVENFLPPDGNLKFGTTNYGTMNFDNPKDSPVIIPAHTAYLTKSKAQDHAMTVTGVAPARSQVQYENARCVEQTQGGHIKKDEYEMQILPFPLREFTFQDRKHVGYNRLWDKIGEFGHQIGANTRGGHLKVYFKEYQKQLDEFVAEFEYIDQQIGAIILINGCVVGIERTPSVEFWKSVWRAIIRDCYGSLAIEAMKNKTKPEYRFPIKQDNINSLNDLEFALGNAEAAERDFARGVIDQIVSNEFRIKETEETPIDVSIIYAENDQLVGQFIMSEGRCIYVSFVIKEAWKKHRNWKEATPFKI
jgi:hypothetical protein